MNRTLVVIGCMSALVAVLAFGWAWFSRPKCEWINVAEKPYWADPTGEEDSTDAIRRAIEAVEKRGGCVYIPPGTKL